MTISQERKAKAKEALANYEKTKSKAIECVDGLKNRCKCSVTTRCIIYNATGDKIKYSGYKDFLGRLYPDQPKARGEGDTYIANGQWDCFLHIRANDTEGTAGAISYDIENKDAARSTNFGYHVCDAVLGWSSPLGFLAKNKAHTEITKPYHINDDNAWKQFEKRVYNSGYNGSAVGHGFKSKVETHKGYSPLFIGLITLEGLQEIPSVL